MRGIINLSRFFLGVLLFLVVQCSIAQEVPRLPNVVLIVSDDQGYQDLGCFGGQEIQTPHLDRLASQGVRCTNFYVSWPACTPSRGSIMTGRYPQRNGLYDMIRNDMVNYKYQYDEVTYALSPEMTLGMDLREVLISQPLQKAGYRCGVFGKWDGGRAKRFLPLQRGFHDFYGFSNTGVDYWTHERYGVPSMFRGNEPIKEPGYTTDLFKREALRFVRENHKRPFFLYLPFNAPHSASNFTHRGVQAPENYLQKYATSQANEKRIAHMACVTCMDDAIGEMVKLIDDLKLTDNTLFIFHSDNGGSTVADNGPLRGHKAQMWEGGLRVPFIAQWKGKIPAGTTRDDFLTTLEIFPTLCALANTSPPKDVILDGFNMLPILQGKASSSRKEMFWQRRNDKAARVGQYKWVDAEQGKGVFDLSQDQGEQHDLSSTRPELLAELRTRFDAWRKTMDESEPRGPFRNY